MARECCAVYPQPVRDDTQRIKMLCIVCHKRVAVVPDRNTTSVRKKVCRDCHVARLNADLRAIAKKPRDGSCSKDGIGEY